MKDSFIGTAVIEFGKALDRALDRGWSTADLRIVVNAMHDASLQAIARREQQMAERARQISSPHGAG